MQHNLEPGLYSTIVSIAIISFNLIMLIVLRKGMYRSRVLLAACQYSLQISFADRILETATSKNINDIQRQCYHQSTIQLLPDKKASTISHLNTKDDNDDTSNPNTITESTTYKLKQSSTDSKTINIKDRIKIIPLQDGIIHVVLSRPSKLNSLDLPMFNAIAEAASLLKHDTTLNKNMRVVIISGEGRAFCTGLDAKSVALSGPKSALNELLQRPSPYGGKDGVGNLAQDVCYLWR